MYCLFLFGLLYYCFGIGVDLLPGSLAPGIYPPIWSLTFLVKKDFLLRPIAEQRPNPFSWLAKNPIKANLPRINQWWRWLNIVPPWSTHYHCCYQFRFYTYSASAPPLNLVVPVKENDGTFPLEGLSLMSGTRWTPVIVPLTMLGLRGTFRAQNFSCTV